MRPPNTVLLYCADEDRRSLLIVQMHLWRLRVTVADSAADVIKTLMPRCFDLVLLVPSTSGDDASEVIGVSSLANRFQMVRGSATRIFDPTHILDPRRTPDIERIPTEGAVALHEALKNAVARRRGPKLRPAAAAVKSFQKVA